MNNNQMKKVERDSSIELLRIFAIFIIILNHYALYSDFDLTDKISFSTILPQWLHMGGKLGVNIFIFISAYFLRDRKKIKLDKVISIILEVLLYSIIIVIIGTVFLKNVNLVEGIEILFAIPSGYMIFITNYIILYILSPGINKFLDNITLKSLLELCAFLTFIWVICPSLTTCVGLNFDFSITYSIAWFVYIYLLAALIKRFEDKIPQKPKKYLFIGFFSVVLIAISEVLIGFAGIYLSKNFAGNEEIFRDYNSIFVVISTVFLFLGFKQSKIKQSYLINKIASTSLGVYILHDNSVYRSFMWNSIFKAPKLQHSNLLILHALGSSIIVFFAFAMVDLLRQRFIERPIMKLLKVPIEKLENAFDEEFEKLAQKIETKKDSIDITSNKD